MVRVPPVVISNLQWTCPVIFQVLLTLLLLVLKIFAICRLNGGGADHLTHLKPHSEAPIYELGYSKVGRGRDGPRHRYYPSRSQFFALNSEKHWRNLVWSL